ncbi:MAG: DUF3169 family protein [Angelakisella sp.]
MNDLKENPGAPKGAPKPARKPYVTVLLFVGFLALCLLVGIGIGRLMVLVMDASPVVADAINAFISDIMVPLQWVIFILLFVGSVAFYWLAKLGERQLRKNDEDEAARDRAEQMLSIGMILSTANGILGYGLFGMSAALAFTEKNGPLLLSGLVLLVAVILTGTIYSTFSVAFIKRLCPEKKGDPLELRFQRQWLNSCDEAERMCIYQAAFGSYKVTERVLLVLWIVTVLLTLYFRMSFYPILVITILWFSHTISYQYYSCKDTSSKKKNKLQ